MSEMTIRLDIENLWKNSSALHEYELIGNLYHEIKTKALGCGQQCPLCRKMCD
jgi:hypothetical protein